jgi:hypothetical protein
MNPQVKTIFETIEQASKSRVTFDEATQQIKGINADPELKANALQLLTTAKSEVDNHAGDNAADRLKAFRRACAPLSNFAQSIRTGGQ